MLRTLHLPLGGGEVASYGFFLVLATVVSVLLGPVLASRLEGLPLRRVAGALVVLGALPWLTGRLHFVATHPELVQGGGLATLRFWSGSIHAGGAILGVVIGLPLVARAFSLPLGKLADGLVPTIGLGTAIARVGCFLQGCCFGIRMDGPLAVSFPPGTGPYRHHAGEGWLEAGAVLSRPVVPLQLGFAALGLLLFGGAIALRHRKRYDGQVALAALFVFALGSALLELLRASTAGRTFWGPLPQLLVVALAIAAASGGCLLALARHPAGGAKRAAAAASA